MARVDGGVVLADSFDPAPADKVLDAGIDETDDREPTQDEDRRQHGERQGFEVLAWGTGEANGYQAAAEGGQVQGGGENPLLLMVALDMDCREKCSVTSALMKVGGSSERRRWPPSGIDGRGLGALFICLAQTKGSPNVRVPNSMNVRNTYAAPETGPRIGLMTPTRAQGEFGFRDGVDGLPLHTTPRSHNENCRATIGQN